MNSVCGELLAPSHIKALYTVPLHFLQLFLVKHSPLSLAEGTLKLQKHVHAAGLPLLYLLQCLPWSSRVYERAK